MKNKNYKLNYNPRYKQKSKKNKIEFSKLWLIGCVLISLLFTTASYVLAWFDKNTVENLSITIIQVMWSMDGLCFFGYIFQNSMRAWSLNKFGKTEINKEIENVNEIDICCENIDENIT